VVIGITGSFGTGKSFVASLFRRMGAKVIDADRLARAALEKDAAVRRKIIAAFGPEILDSGDAIDRKRLGKIVFSDRKALNRLNGIIHPVVISAIKRFARDNRARATVVIDAPLLVEAGLAGLVDRLIVVKASRANQIKRCIKKFGMTREDVLKRAKSQAPLRKKEKMADFVIDNDGARSGTRRQVKMIWEEIRWN
jgi:dephospho-CoA kinase